MQFKINQKVVCINNKHHGYCSHPLEKGGIYTVYGFCTCQCGSEQIFLDEISDVVLMKCKCNRLSERRHSYYAHRFRPLQFFNLYHELLDESVELGDKSDLPKVQPEILTETNHYEAKK